MTETDRFLTRHNLRHLLAARSLKAGLTFRRRATPWPAQTAFSALVEPQNVGYAHFVMQTFHAETVVEKNGKLHLDQVPFSEGEAVHVFISSATPAKKQPLEGSVLKYEQPFAPVAEEDWEAAR